jgi:hypothetical protein
MKTTDPISPLRFSPIGVGLVMALACLPLVVPTVAWVWHLTAQKSLWQVAEQLRPFTLFVTSVVAMPKLDDLEIPVHELVYAVLLAGWAIVMALYVILLFRFRRHIPAWIRSKKGREAGRMQTAKSWTLPAMYLLWFVILVDILVFGQIFSFAWLGIGYQAPSFGEAMFRLSVPFLVFYVFSLNIVPRIMFRFYRDTSFKRVGV